MNILTLLIFIPFAFGLIIALMPSNWRGAFKYITLLATLVQLGMSICIYLHFKTGAAYGGIANEGQFQFVQKLPWINLNLGSMGHMQMEYFVGIDGISITLLVMTSLVLVVAALSSWEIKSNLKGFFVLFLILDMAVLGVFCSLDFFLFYIFYELMLLPLYFLIGMWGGARREYAAIKFFLYTLFGSVFMLLVMIGLYLSVKDPVTGAHTFNMVQMMNPANYGHGSVFSMYSRSSNAVWHTGTYAGLCGIVYRFRHKSPGSAPAHLAARRARGSAYTGIYHFSGYPVKNWRLRYYPGMPGYFPRGRCFGGILAGFAGCYLYSVRCVQRAGTARSETAHRLFIRIANGFCAAGDSLANHRGYQRRGDANGEPRVFINHAVLFGRSGI